MIAVIDRGNKRDIKKSDICIFDDINYSSESVPSSLLRRMEGVDDPDDFLDVISAFSSSLKEPTALSLFTTTVEAGSSLTEAQPIPLILRSALAHPPFVLLLLVVVDMDLSGCGGAFWTIDECLRFSSFVPVSPSISCCEADLLGGGGGTALDPQYEMVRRR